MFFIPSLWPQDDVFKETPATTAGDACLCLHQNNFDGLFEAFPKLCTPYLLKLEISVMFRSLDSDEDVFPYFIFGF